MTLSIMNDVLILCSFISPAYLLTPQGEDLLRGGMNAERCSIR